MSKKTEQTGNTTKRHEDFKEELVNCEVISVWKQLFSQLENLNYSSENKVDNSMCRDSDTEKLLSGIVGILEGFELLDSQSDNNRTIAEELLSIIGNKEGRTIVSQGDNSTTLAAPAKGVLGHEEQAIQLSEQFARMLQNNQLAALPRQSQKEILKVVGEYLCSFESTNNKQSNNMNMDKLDTLLLKAKTVLKTDDVRNIETGISKEHDVRNIETGISKEHDVTGIETVIPKTKESFSNDISAKKETPINVMATVSESFSEVEEVVGTMKDTQSGFVKENVIRIVDKVSTQASEGRYDFDIELKPDFLGKLNIKLTMENGDIKMLIKTEEMAVKGLFSDQIPALQNMLKEKGINISQIDVKYDGETFMNNERQSFGQNSDSGGKKRNWRNNLSVDQVTGCVLYDSMMDLPSLFLGSSSSVEFSA